MKSKLWIAFIVGVLCASPVFAGDGDNGNNKEGKWRQRFEERMQKLYDELNISPEQKTLLDANRQKHREAKTALREKIRIMMKIMGEELKKDELDMVKLNTLQDELNAAQAQMANARFQSILEVRKILTKEQFGEFIKNIEGRFGRFQRDNKE